MRKQSSIIKPSNLAFENVNNSPQEECVFVCAYSFCKGPHACQAGAKLPILVLKIFKIIMRHITPS